MSPVSGQKNEKILDTEEVGCCKTLVSIWLTPWYYISDDSNLQNTTKSHSTGRMILLVLPVYIPVFYVASDIRLSKWNSRLRVIIGSQITRQYLHVGRQIASKNFVLKSILIEFGWRKNGAWNEIISVGFIIARSTYVTLTTYFHLQPRLRTSKLYLHSPIRLHSVMVNQTQDEVTSQVRQACTFERNDEA